MHKLTDSVLIAKQCIYIQYRTVKEFRLFNLYVALRRAKRIDLSLYLKPENK